MVSVLRKIEKDNKIEGIFISINGFNEEAIEKLKANNIMYSDFERWFGNPKA